MIQLLVVSPQTGNPFERFPQLHGIWADPNLQALAEESTRKAIEYQMRQPDHSTGPIYLIVQVDESTQRSHAIGLTGFYFSPQDPENVHLRWHGLVPGARGRGLGRAVLERMMEEARAFAPQAVRFCEMLPCSGERAAIEPFFKGLGFVANGPEETHPLAAHAWQPIARSLHTLELESTAIVHSSGGESSPLALPVSLRPTMTTTRSSSVGLKRPKC